ncbi:DUF6941 family protein [Rhodococcus pyridinivorans]
MAELDYAYVAEFAKVEGGTLSAIGASYTAVQADSLPTTHVFACAGRVRLAAGEEPAEIRVRIVAPGKDYELVATGIVDPESGTEYDNKVAGVFAFTNSIPLRVEGLYEVFVEINGEEVRRLAFEVRVSQS